MPREPIATPSLTEPLLVDEFEAVCGEGAVSGVRFSDRGDFAHVELKDEATAEMACKSMNTLEVLGRRMRVDRVGHKSSKKQRGGGGR